MKVNGKMIATKHDHHPKNRISFSAEGKPFPPRRRMEGSNGCKFHHKAAYVFLNSVENKKDDDIFIAFVRNDISVGGRKISSHKDRCSSF